jgi:hypothetical protein
MGCVLSERGQKEKPGAVFHWKQDLASFHSSPQYNTTTIIHFGVSCLFVLAVNDPDSFVLSQSDADGARSQTFCATSA